MYQAKNDKNKVVMGREEYGLNSGGKDVHKQKILVVDDESRMRKTGKGFSHQKRISRYWKQVTVRRPWIFL